MQENKKLPHKYVTLLVMLDAVSDPKSFRMKTVHLKLLVGFTAGFLVLLACSLIYYYAFAYKVFYYDDLKSRFDQLSEDNKRIQSIEREFRKVKQENEKIRLVFGMFKNIPKDTTERDPSTRYEDFTSAKEMGYYPGGDLNDPVHEKIAAIADQESRAVAGDYMLYARVVPARMPVQTRWISREFKNSPTSFNSTKHIGVDLVAAEGTIVVATSEGWVVTSEWSTDYGNTIVLYHGYGFFTLYKHLQYSLVTAGSSVKSGELIGSVGNTGLLTTGPHLHFEVWRDGQAQNPADYIPQIREALRVTLKEGNDSLSARKKI